MKKFLAFLLSFAMICSMMTVVTFADSESNENVEENENVIALELVELDDEQLATLSYVPFSSGVYRFDSMYNTGMCMMVEDGEYTSGAAVVQWNTSSNDCDTLFKVEYAGTGIIPASSSTADYYVIRSMVNSEIGLTAAPITSGSNAVTLQTLDADNDNQMWTQYWVHMEDSGCDVWMNAATGTCLGTPDTTTSGSDLEMTTSTTNAWWQLVEYTGSVIEGVVFTAGPTSTYGGGIYYYDAYMYSSEIGVNGPVVYGVRNGSGEATIVSSSGRMDPDKEGTVTVYATAAGMTTEATRTVSITGYSDANHAALAFAQEYGSAAEYVNFELTSMIYKVTSSGVTTYYYTSPEPGDPHNFDTTLNAPIGTTGVAIVFIQLDQTSLSFADKNRFQQNYSGLDMYALLSGSTVVWYSPGLSDDHFEVDSVETPLLSHDEEVALVSEYRSEWEVHCATCPDCDVTQWPIP